jgi:hypothetical protein
MNLFCTSYFDNLCIVRGVYLRIFLRMLHFFMQRVAGAWRCCPAAGGTYRGPRCCRRAGGAEDRTAPSCGCIAPNSRCRRAQRSRPAGWGAAHSIHDLLAGSLFHCCNFRGFLNFHFSNKIGLTTPPCLMVSNRTGLTITCQPLSSLCL